MPSCCWHGQQLHDWHRPDCRRSLIQRRTAGATRMTTHHCDAMPSINNTQHVELAAIRSLKPPVRMVLSPGKHDGINSPAKFTIMYLSENWYWASHHPSKKMHQYPFCFLDIKQTNKQRSRHKNKTYFRGWVDNTVVNKKRLYANVI